MLSGTRVGHLPRLGQKNQKQCPGKEAAGSCDVPCHVILGHTGTLSRVDISAIWGATDTRLGLETRGRGRKRPHSFPLNISGVIFYAWLPLTLYLAEIMDYYYYAHGGVPLT